MGPGVSTRPHDSGSSSRRGRVGVLAGGPRPVSQMGKLRLALGTLDALILSHCLQSPALDDCVSVFTCKTRGPETGIVVTGRAEGWGKTSWSPRDVLGHFYFYN